MHHRTLARLMLAAFALILVGAWGAPAQAMLYRNPVQDVRSGQMAAGFGLSRDLLSLFWDYGVGANGTLDVELGNLDLPAGASGMQIGVGYRHEINRKPNVGSKAVRLAPFGLLNIGTGDADFTQLDLGFGGAYPIQKEFSAFGSAVFRYLDTPGGSDTRLGVVLGGEFRPVENWLIGAELHLGFSAYKDTFGLYTALRF